jgi:HK97 family phage prohead protease
MKRETRDRVGEIRATTVTQDGTEVPGVDLQVIKTNVVDEYGSLWLGTVFDKSLAKRMPVLCWSHDWSNPLGPPLSYELDAVNGPRVRFAFSNFDDVPTARRAHSQTKDGTIQDCSVGFSVPLGGRREPTDAEQEQFPGVVEVIEEADLDEVSLVLRGAVPGAKVLAVRSAVGTVDIDAVVEIAKRKASGELTAAEADAALDLLATKGAGEGSEVPSPPSEPDPALDEAETMEIPDL